MNRNLLYRVYAFGGLVITTMALILLSIVAPVATLHPAIALMAVVGILGGVELLIVVADGLLRHRRWIQPFARVHAGRLYLWLLLEALLLSQLVMLGVGLAIQLEYGDTLFDQLILPHATSLGLIALASIATFLVVARRIEQGDRMPGSNGDNDEL